MKTQYRSMEWDKKPPERDSHRDKYLRHDKNGWFQSVKDELFINCAETIIQLFGRNLG